MHSVLRQLAAAGYGAELEAFSALDRYFDLDNGPYLLVRTDAGLADLAKLFDLLRFPGAAVADAAYGGPLGTGTGEPPVYFICRDSDDVEFAGGRTSFPILRFSYDAAERRFRDPLDLYAALRDFRKGLSLPWSEGPEPSAEKYAACMDAALLVSRYGFPALNGPEGDSGLEGPLRTLAERLSLLGEGPPPAPERQQQFLAFLLCSRRPELGLELLKKTGFVARFWPELAAMDDVDHSKEFHPEGNAWAHTLETFRYRKKEDLILSLGLLLHDVGKPLSEASAARRFDRHAELGADAAGKFLRRLGFSDAVTEQVRYLVRHHMMPAALPRLPLNRTQEALESPLFPTLLELYRCDESSSFKGPEGYYESAAAYRAYLRNVKNPYRSADGKKLTR